MNTVTISLEKYEEMKHELKSLKEFLNSDKSILIKFDYPNRTRYTTRLIDDVYTMHEKEINHWKELYLDEIKRIQDIKQKIEKSFICKLLKIKL